MKCTNEKQSELGNLARKAFSLATDANNECVSTRALVGDVKRETLLEARLEAESMVDRAEGRVGCVTRRRFATGTLPKLGDR